VPSINFFSADKTYPIKNKNKIKDWIRSEAIIYNKRIEEINIIFCSDEYLIDLNNKFLNHNYYTDVITFDNSVENNISGEIYISVDRLKENAKNLKCKLFDEFIRIIIHGSLHLFGFGDKSEKDKQIMTQKENEAISRFYNLE
jgi:probable rRNA maturation factor